MQSDPASLSYLVVDNDPFARGLMVRVLGRLGATHVTVADDGLHALMLLSAIARLPEIVLCDLRMPKVDGIELLRQLGERKILARSFGLYVLGAVAKPPEKSAVEAMIRTYEPHRIEVPTRQVDPITEAELVEGLDTAMEVIYQPKVTTAGRQVVGVEALARWNHPTRGMLGPSAFVPLAEETGHMQRLTDEVLRRAIPQMVDWTESGLDLELAVNVSADILHRRSLAADLPRYSAQVGLDPARLTLEITETRLMGQLTEQLEVAARLRLARVGLSIDDFGTGYSSLEQLKRVPFTELKIDRAFVHGAVDDARARTILRSSVDLGRALDMQICAEGVETQEDWDLISSLGCDKVQGYFVARPMHAREIPGWIKTWESRSAARRACLRAVDGLASC